MDLVAYDSAQVLDQMYLSKLRQGKFDNADKSAVTRYVLPLALDENAEGKEEVNLKNKAGINFPRTNRNLRISSHYPQSWQFRRT